MDSHNKPPSHSYSLDELCALVDLPKRTVRYYVQIGLVSRPEGEKRGAYYTEHHLEQLLTIRKWSQAGLSLERIGELLAGQDMALPPPRARAAGTVEVHSHLVVADGLEVVLEPSRAGLSPAQVRTFFRGVTELYQRIQGKK